jgi:hypothetical protein
MRQVHAKIVEPHLLATNVAIRLYPQPVRELVGKPIELARSLGDFEFRLDRAGAQAFADGIP